MTHYTIKAFAHERMDPVEEIMALAHDDAAVDAGRGLLRRRKTVHQVEVWRDARRIATVERVV